MIGPPPLQADKIQFDNGLASNATLPGKRCSGLISIIMMTVLKQCRSLKDAPTKHPSNITLCVARSGHALRSSEHSQNMSCASHVGLYVGPKASSVRDIQMFVLRAQSSPCMSIIVL